MYRFLGWVAAVGLGLMVLSGCTAPGAHFGQPMKMDGQKTLTVTQVLSDVRQYHHKYIRVAGIVTEVSDQNGYWMKIADQPNGPALLLKLIFDKNAGCVPVVAKGHQAVVEGTLVVETMTEAQRKHYAQLSGNRGIDSKNIRGPKITLELMCPSAKIDGVQASRPPAKPSQKG
jgi:hypothetical protein